MTDEFEPVNPSDLMLRILEQIRDEIRSTRVELSTTRVELSTRIDQTNARLDSTRVELSTRIGAVESTLVELATQQRATVTFLREHVAGDFADLRRRVQVLEARAG
jgi:hypothetical protein